MCSPPAKSQGTYSRVPGHVTWSGDIGVVRQDQIVASNLDQGNRADDVWFKFQYAPDTTNTVNCKL